MKLSTKWEQVITHGNFIQVIKNILIAYPLMLIFELLIVLVTYNSVKEQQLHKIDKAVYTEGYDLELICNLANCKMIQNYLHDEDSKLISKDTYIKDERGLLRLTSDKIENYQTYYNLDYILDYNGTIILVDNTDNKNLILSLLYWNTGLFIFLFLLIQSRMLYISVNTNIIDVSYHRTNIESKLQRDITESLHHEMGAPISIVRSTVADLYKVMYPCSTSKDGICSLYCKDNKVTCEITCSDCKFKYLKRESDVKALDIYSGIMYSLDRIQAILEQTGNTKQIKYSNGNICIYNILTNVIDANNNFRVIKLDAEYHDLDILKTYAVGHGLHNGDVLNIIHSHVVNSIEAKATRITFQARLIDNNTKVELYFKDNGFGIKNKFGELIDVKDRESIFTYGYSSKDMEGNQIEIDKDSNIIGRIQTNSPSVRGAGLYVNREIVRKAKGDIYVVDTSNYGTIFKIIIPVKVRRDH